MYLIIDSHHLCHKAKWALKDSGLTFNDLNTSIIFGFLKDILTLSEKFPEHKFIFAWDSRASHRMEIYPEYKKKRLTKEKTPEELELDAISYPQFKIIRTDVLPSMGFSNIFIQTGKEADDIIASLVLNNHNSFVIVSTDNDLFQLLSPSVSMYSPQTKKTITHKTFERDKGIKPSEWGTVLTIKGCDTDGVSGVEGVGEVRAINFLQGKLKENSKIVERIQSSEGRAIKDRNKSLVLLPMGGTKVFEVTPDNLTITKFKKTFERFGMNFFLNNFDRWIRAFDLEFNLTKMVGT